MDTVRPLVFEFVEQLSDMPVSLYWRNLGNVLQDLQFLRRF